MQKTERLGKDLQNKRAFRSRTDRFPLLSSNAECTAATPAPLRCLEKSQKTFPKSCISPRRRFTHSRFRKDFSRGFNIRFDGSRRNEAEPLEPIASTRQQLACTLRLSSQSLIPSRRIDSGDARPDDSPAAGPSTRMRLINGPAVLWAVAGNASLPRKHRHGSGHSGIRTPADPLN